MTRSENLLKDYGNIVVKDKNNPMSSGGHWNWYAYKTTNCDACNRLIIGTSTLLPSRYTTHEIKLIGFAILSDPLPWPNWRQDWSEHVSDRVPSDWNVLCDWCETALEAVVEDTPPAEGDA